MQSLKTLTGSFDAGKIKGILLLVLILPLTLVHSGCVGLAGSNSLPLSLSNPAPGGVSSNSAMVSWTTNIPATSQVEYGTSTNYGLNSAFDPALVNNHAQALTALSAATTYHYRVHSKDAAGIEAVSGDFTLTTATIPDTTPPTVAITSPAPAATVSGMVAVVATASDNVGVVGVQFQVDSNNTGAEVLAAPYTYSLNTATLSNGSHSLTAVARDAAGNRGTSAALTIAVNNQVPPTISIISPAAGVTLSGTISVSTSVSSNTASVQFQVDGGNTGAPVTSAPFSYSLNTATLSNANHSIAAIASSSSGQTASASVTANVNNIAPPTPPTISISSPASGATGSGTITVSTSVSSNTVSVQFKVDGGNTGTPVTSAPFSYSLNTTSLSNGSHSLTAVASNAAAQTTTSAAVSISVNNVAPPTPPTISITSPASGATVSGTITVSTNVSTNTASVQFQMDGGNTGTPVTSAPFSYSLNTTTLSNGNHSISVVASNSSGQTASASVTVNVNNLDTTPPTVSITSPAAGASVSGTISVSANASDNVGVVGVQFKLDGANIGSEDLSSPYSISWSTTGSPNGSHTLTAVARDAAGNSTTSAAVVVNVNNVVAVTISPTSASAPVNGTQQFTATVTGSTNTAVSWSVTGDGTLSASGLFTAGAVSGSATVTATAAADPTKLASASVTVTAVTSGLPTSLGWYQIPNTQQAPVCPADTTGCQNVIAAWGSGIADTKRNRLVFWGGGHGDYGGNEVYALDLNTLQMLRLNNHSPLNTGSCIETLSDGNPNARHSYDDLAYIASADQMFSYTGALYCSNGSGSTAVWTLDLPTLTWAQKITSTLTPNGGFASADYDPNSGNVFVHTESWGMFGKYNLASNTMTTLATFLDVNYYVTAVVDPKRKAFFMFGANQAFRIDISGADTTYGLHTLAATGCSFISADAPGAAYDPVQDRVVGWSGGNTVYLYNPDTDSCTSVTYPNGPGAPQANGTNGRFRYFPALNVFALVNDWQQNAFALRLTSGGGSPPPPAAPIISGVTATGITTTGATIKWATDQASTSRVEYGTTTSYGSTTSLLSTLVTRHSQLLSGLSAGTVYHYRVHSKNSSGLESISGDFVFGTSNSSDNTPPTVSLTAPLAGATLTGMASIAANATDNVGVVGVQFLLDGNNLGAELTAIPYSILWDSTTAANGTHTLAATARDAAGNRATSTAVSVTLSNTTTTAGADFQARCTAPGVVKCVGWDSASDFVPASGGGGYADGLYPADDGTFQGTQDSTTSTSGTSLKFNIRAGNVSPLGSNPAGLWKANFPPVGQNQTLYFQFRLRLSPEMLNFPWNSVSGEGWKVFIAFGPVPGPSCTGDQFVQENTYQTNVATAYASCGSPALYTNNGIPPMLIEQGDYNCAYDSSGAYSTNPNCFTYPANTWMTEYWVVQVGSFGQPNSHFTAYIAPTGQPLKKFIDLPNFVFNNGGSASEALQQLILQPYFSGAFNATTNPAAAMWFDELIISTQPIAAPK